jgi:SAM-dependent methyltransferase
MPDPTRRAHWNEIYTSRSDSEVSWFEPAPDTSIALIERAGIGPDAAAIDIGGGASRLVDWLLARRLAHVAVLDLSEAALDAARRRLGPAADGVEWIVADVTAWRPERTYDLWHDRAALHFLIDPADQRAYVEALNLALVPGGTVIIGTFALDGPERCSGLPVARHDAATLGDLLGPGYTFLFDHQHTHHTPGEVAQRFQYSAFRRA